MHLDPYQAKGSNPKEIESVIKCWELLIIPFDLVKTLSLYTVIFYLCEFST